ncbi:4-carboxymuconolactone decarboxylase [Afipia massiliensis]|uniref:4-carboxymuconolactone decarboxylase n=1 Tax=Afipia massiliensis TaxID=211460 RepID=A0A840MZL2_9BRAD|nr:carboxymuconolactone decarboxylase family protein [Afipia massiliensis]MBB5053273.1 4-carboxymuconolactone decarboxylase [Afipia massiliensis]
MRLRTLSPSEMTADQKSIYEESVSSKRGTVTPPLRAWIHAPEVARHAGRLGAFLRYDTTLGPLLSELAILVTARHWSAQFEWYAHKKLALAAGLDSGIIDAINHRHVPDFDDPKAQLIYEFSESLHENCKVPKLLYDKAIEMLGETGVVELVGLLGYYALVSMTLNTFEVELPEGETSDLVP